MQPPSSPTPRVSLLFGVHAHQPVGNFPAVVDDALERCYRPFLRTMLRYPKFRFAAHFSGWLLGELLERFPDDMQILGEMVERGQVELFGAGDCEPVLASIPARDRLTQLGAMSDRLQRAFGVRPHGAWLTERVWESGVVPSLVRSGIRYVVVDDYHFMCTGRPVETLDGYFSTEEDGQRLDVFPISEALRYRLPFSPAPDAIAWLEGLADRGHDAAIYFDDIEKFGIWPETYEWVYNKGWLERFVEGVLSSPKIVTTTYDHFHAHRPGRGIVYLPTTSYIEMNEWTLPAPAAAAFADLGQREREAGRFEQTKAFVRGGIWRNFLSRYPEANWMHKRMLGLSGRLAALGPGIADHIQLQRTLHRAQSNDAYWHGLFGGLYLPHLRRSVYRNLVELERALDAVQPRPSLECHDVDLDGHDEWFLRARSWQVVIRDDGNASVHEFDSYRLLHNFADTLARRREAYHARAIDKAPAHAHSGDGIASAHERLDFKHAIAPADLDEDRRPRTMLLDTLRRPDGVREALSTYRALVPADRHTSISFEAHLGPARVVKSYSIARGSVEVAWRCIGLHGWRLTTQLNLSMPSCDGYFGRYVLADESIPCGFGQPLELDAASRLTLDDQELQGWLRIECEPAAAVTGRPYHTVSLSEAGLEKIMQAAVVELDFAIDGNDALIRLQLTPGH